MKVKHILHKRLNTFVLILAVYGGVIAVVEYILYLFDRGSHSFSFNGLIFFFSISALPLLLYAFLFSKIASKRKIFIVLGVLLLIICTLTALASSLMLALSGGYDDSW